MVWPHFQSSQTTCQVPLVKSSQCIESTSTSVDCSATHGPSPAWFPRCFHPHLVVLLLLTSIDVEIPVSMQHLTILHVAFPTFTSQQRAARNNAPQHLANNNATSNNRQL